MKPRAFQWSELSTPQRVASGGIVILATAFSWAYWPTVTQLLHSWSTQPDYSHGFVVLPLSLFLLWIRRDSRPSQVQPAFGTGLLLIMISLGVRVAGLRYSFDALDGYSLIIWVCGVVLLLLGRAYLVWSLPSILFLLFMIPLPFQVERLLSVPLQRVATSISCFMLQCLGQPAFAEGTTILLGPHQLFVEQACSGLRMFVGTLALACAYLIATRRELWEQLLLICTVVPIALLANATRIVATGLMYQHLHDEQLVQKLSHDLAGLFMIPLAATMFACTLWYSTRLLRPIEVIGTGELVGRERASEG